MDEAAEGSAMDDAVVPESPAPAPAREESADVGAPQRYKVQFTATDEYVRLIERAKALLSHSLPNAAFEEIQLRALRAYVAELEKLRYAVTSRPRTRAGAERSERDAASHSASEQPANDDQSEKRQDPRRRGRHVPAAVRRAVFERDGGRCSYVDASGKRCRETHSLELHHLEAFAKGCLLYTSPSPRDS